MLEAYSVLTRLPGGLAVPAAEAAVALEARAHDEVLITLDERAQQTYARLGAAYRAV